MREKIYRGPRYYLTNHLKDEIRKMFFGPYLEEWRDKDGLVDNSDSAIGNRLGIDERVAGNYIRFLLKEHFEEMKNKAVIVFLLLTTFCSAQVVTFIDKDWTQLNVWVDPTLTDQGFQTGYEIEKVMHWGYASAAFSIYDGLEVRYSDVVGTLGVNFNMFNNDVIRYYGGWRMGFISRKHKNTKATYPMFGSVIGFNIRLSRFNTINKMYVGYRLWIDYREDQKNKFYGNSELYKRGIITNNSLLQENGGLVFSFSW